jgi:GNAT superfamily N-acetyltransferase
VTEQGVASHRRQGYKLQWELVIGEAGKTGPHEVFVSFVVHLADGCLRRVTPETQRREGAKAEAKQRLADGTARSLTRARRDLCVVAALRFVASATACRRRTNPANPQNALCSRREGASLTQPKDIPRSEIFRRHAAQARKVLPAGYRRDEVDGITRFTPIARDLDGIVAFAELSEASIDATIASQLEYFEKLQRPFEWKVYDFDTPADLGVRLERRGFERGDAEALMLYDVAPHRSRGLGSQLRVDRITSRVALARVVAVQERVWGRAFPWLEPSLAAAMNRTAIFCAYQQEQMIGTGWLEFPEGCDFAEMHGGAVLPAFRGRGVYSALFDVRIDEAKSRGRKYVAVDASPLSKPILLKKGFSHVCDTIPFRLRQPPSA